MLRCSQGRPGHRTNFLLVLLFLALVDLFGELGDLNDLLTNPLDLVGRYVLVDGHVEEVGEELLGGTGGGRMAVGGRDDLELGGSLVGVDAPEVELFVAEVDLVVRHQDGEEPEGPVLGQVAWHFHPVLHEVVLGVELVDVGQHGL